MSATSKTPIGKFRSSKKSQHLSSTSETKYKPVMTPSGEFILPVPLNHVIELTMKENKGQKYTLPVVNSSPGQKAEKKKSTGSWGNIFRQQSISKVENEQCTKFGSQNEDKKVKMNINIKKQQKSPVKRPMKSEAKPSTTLCGCSSVLVRDCAVQCEIYNSNKLSELAVCMSNSIKELKDLVNKKDEKQCDILTKMEHICEKLLNSKSKTDFNIAPLKECKKMKTSNDLFILEREKLESEILIQAEKVKEVENKCSELSFRVKTLTQQLNKATSEKNDTISLLTNLRQQIEDNEIIITTLETNLSKQTELAHKNDIENKHLTMEINKISIMSSNQEKLINGYRKLTIDLKNQIAKQLQENCVYKKEDSISSQISLVNTGLAYSSPTSSFSDGSNDSLMHDLSDISSVDSVIMEEHTLRKDLPKDSEFVSLLDEGSSYTMLEQNEASNYKGSALLGNNENNIISRQNVDTNNVSIKKYISKKSHNKENEMHNTGKFTRLKEQQDDNTKNLFLNASKAFENITSIKSTNSNIRKQVDMLNRKSVYVPCSLRDCPRSDWSDSSLPSISTVSSLNLMPSQTTLK